MVRYCGGKQYLGYVIGPDGHLTNWDKATQKYLKRTQEWADLGLGMLHSAAAYAIYILPILTFLEQPSEPPEEVYLAESSPSQAAARTKPLVRS